MRRFLCAAVLLLATAATAAEPAGVRLGSHDGYGRVVFDFPEAVGFTAARAGDTVVLRFTGDAAVPSAAGGARNVVGVAGGAGMATVTVTPGARLRATRLGKRVVVDVLDARAAKPAAPRPAAPAPSAPPPSGPRRDEAAAMPAVQTAPVVPVLHEPDPAPEPVAAPLPASAPPQPAEPLELAASHPRDAPDGSVLLPFGPATAAAAFRHGSEGWIVFDERRPLDLDNLRGDPVMAGASVQLLEAATVVRIPLPPGQLLILARQDAGWTVAASGAVASPPSLAPQSRAQRLMLDAAGPGQVVTVAEPDSGGNLLVGTLRAAGPGVPVPYNMSEFSIRPSWQGVVVEPHSDRAVLRPVPGGFAIDTADPAAATPDAGRALADAAVLTRRFDLPAEPAATLLRRLQVQVADEGRAPPQSRLGPRKAAAQTLIALGLGAEAQSVLRLAVAEDPRAQDDPGIRALTAIAALLAGRPAEADGLLDPALSGSDEVALWRAVRLATLQPASQEAARVFAATAGLVLSYPAALRSRLLPLAAETLAAGGAATTADALLAKLPDEPLLAFTRAIRLAAKGDAAAALTLYDALATGRDRLMSARASTAAALLRLETGATGPAEAAKTLERGFLAWRGDDRERDLRLRVAGLRAQAGQWRAAFDMLRETAPLYPESAALLQARTAAMLADMLRGPAAAAVPPLDLVALADENAELVAQADAAPILADKLAALDLPRRAAPILARMAAAAPPGADRARLGERLAAMRFGEGDGAAAAAALAASAAADLPADLADKRGLLDACIHARAHDVAGATAILAGIGSPAADDLRASILGEAGDWRGAAAALRSLAGQLVPAEGELTPAQQDLLVRLASAQARAGDEAGLRELGARQAARISPPRSDMFRLLTAAPVGDVGDLRRSAGEIALARALPVGLAAIGGH